MKKVTGGWDWEGMGHVDRLSRGRPGSKLKQGCGGAACIFAAVVTHAVLCRSDSGEPGARSVALTARFVCSQKSAREEGFCFSLPET